MDDPLEAFLEEFEDEEVELTPLEEVEEKLQKSQKAEDVPVQEAIKLTQQLQEAAAKSGLEGGIQRDDSDTEELYVHRRDLTESGKDLELKLNAASKGPDSTDAWRSKKKSVLTGLKDDVKNEGMCVSFDKFNIVVRDPKVSSQTFGMFTAGMKLVKLGELKNNSVFKEAWVTLGIIVEKSLSKKSANGNEYLIWKIHELKDCQLEPLKLLLFGDSVKEHWKIPTGSCIALLSAQVADNTAGATMKGKKVEPVTLKVAKSTNIVEIGPAKYFGICKGTRAQDNQRCRNFVNTSLSEFCVYHVMSVARKLSANRGTFNAITCGLNVGALLSGGPKKPTSLGMGATVGQRKIATARSLQQQNEGMKASACNSFESSLKTTTREEEKNVLEDLISHRKNSLGSRQILKLKEKCSSSGSPVQSKFGCFTDFLETRKAPEPARPASPPSLWSEQNSGSMRIVKEIKDAKEHAARLRAIAMMKKKREDAANGVKRKRPAECEENEAKRPKTEEKVSKMDEIKALLKRESLHSKQAEKAIGDRFQKHLSDMEEKEKVETFTTTCMAVKNVSVVTCKQCKYTSQFQSSICKEQGHEVKKHSAEKRFFKCTACKKRTICFDLLPTRPCDSCHENNWTRVAMRDERKVMLETENLQLRGEERKFVNR